MSSLHPHRLWAQGLDSFHLPAKPCPSLWCLTPSNPWAVTPEGFLKSGIKEFLPSRSLAASKTLGSSLVSVACGDGQTPNVPAWGSGSSWLSWATSHGLWTALVFLFTFFILCFSSPSFSDSFEKVFCSSVETISLFCGWSFPDRPRPIQANVYDSPRCLLTSCPCMGQHFPHCTAVHAVWLSGQLTHLSEGGSHPLPQVPTSWGRLQNGNVCTYIWGWISQILKRKKVQVILMQGQGWELHISP